MVLVNWNSLNIHKKHIAKEYRIVRVCQGTFHFVSISEWWTICLQHLRSRLRWDDVRPSRSFVRNEKSAGITIRSNAGQK